VILVVSLNPAVDVTHHVAGADWSGVNRPHSVRVQAGGKGLNVARTLRALGQPAMVTGLVGGLTGHAVLGGLTAAGIDTALTQIADETRRTFAVSDTVRGETALFNEPGPVIRAEEYERFFVAYEQRLQSCAAVVLSGSLPRGLPADTYARLIAAAAAAAVPVILDASGPALSRGAAARPTLVKPNLAELETAVGRSLGPPERPDLAAVDQAARSMAGLAPADPRIRKQPGTNSVVVSLGAHGLLGVCAGGALLAQPPAGAAGNPTGAGDAAVAGLADGLVRGRSWPELLAHATALGTAAVGSSPAGTFSTAEYWRLLPVIRVASLGHGFTLSGLMLCRRPRPARSSPWRGRAVAALRHST
jgi:tagatose 6-phosphate kinase